MNSSVKKSDIDRLPSKFESFIGCVGGLLISIIFALFSFYSLELKSYFWTIIFLLISFISTYIAYRAALSPNKKPNKRAIKYVNYVFTICGLCLLITPVLISFSSISHTIYSISLGLTCLSFGVNNLINIK